MDKKINIHQSIMNNTTNNEFNTLCLMYLIGNDNNKETVLYHKNLYKKLEELKEQGIKVPSKKTIQKHIKKLSKIFFDDSNIPLVKMENSDYGLVYKIPQSYEGKYFVTIPYEQMKELINDKIIKVYCVIAGKLQINNNEFTKFTREYICNSMGIEPIKSNLNYISRQLTLLKKSDYIELKRDSIIVLDEEGNKQAKTYNYYKLKTIE